MIDDELIKYFETQIAIVLDKISQYENPEMTDLLKRVEVLQSRVLMLEEETTLIAQTIEKRRFNNLLK